MIAMYAQVMKRTTLILEDAVLDAIRHLAHRERKSLSDIVNALLVEGLERRKRRPTTEFTLPSFPMGKPRVNLGDRNVLEALMDS
jgi:hypothetical protein